MKGGNEYKKGLWTVEEDRILMEYIRVHVSLESLFRIENLINFALGLKRCRKSCTLRWMNYLSPNVKRGDFSEKEMTSSFDSVTSLQQVPPQTP
ncbi:hypothetical protein EV1_028308 [Malus domestica]